LWMVLIMRMPWILDFGWKRFLFCWRIWRPRHTGMMHDAWRVCYDMP
jgi:hypothetical protein